MNGYSRLLIRDHRNGSGIGNGLVSFAIPSDGDRVQPGFAKRRQYQRQIDACRRHQKRGLILLRTATIGAMAAKIEREGSDGPRFRACGSPGDYVSQKKTNKQTCGTSGDDQRIADCRAAALRILRVQVEELWQTMVTIDHVLTRASDKEMPSGCRAYEARNASVTHSGVGEASARIWLCFLSRERSQPSTSSFVPLAVVLVLFGKLAGS
jgi:hypothetical protein